MTDRERPMGERVATVESWIAGHEKLCADRYGLLMKVVSIGGAILIAVAGWGLSSVWQAQQDQMKLIQAAMTQMATAKH